MFAGPFAPLGWMYCDGRELLIAEYQQLYIRLGQIYGQSHFADVGLPDD